MKTQMTKVAVLVTSLGCLTAAGQGLQLAAGETYTYSFSSMEFLGPAADGSLGSAAFVVRFLGDLLDPTDSIRLEMFEGSVASSPFASDTFLGANPPLARVQQDRSQVIPHWADLQGAVRLTMLTGSANVERIGVFADIGRFSYGNSVAVPEPSSLALFCLAGLASGLWIWKRCRRPNTARGCVKSLGLRAGRGQDDARKFGEPMFFGWERPGRVAGSVGMSPCVF